jgi:hypothetical protein
MNTILAWLKSRNITSHTITAFLVAAAGLIVGDQQVRSFLMSTFSAHPKIAAEIVAAAGIILGYSNPVGPAAAPKAALEAPVPNPDLK